MSRILTLYENEQGRQDVDQVHSHNHKPEHGNHPPMDNDAEESHGKRGFTQRTSHDGQNFTNVT